MLTLPLSIAAGIPYHVRVYAENTHGRGSYCITTDFGDQLSTYKDVQYSISLTHYILILQLPLAISLIYHLVHVIHLLSY